MITKANESQHGLEYAWEVVSACEKAGIQCIADERPQGEILFYDPTGRKYATDRDLMDADVQIWDLLPDDNDKKDDIERKKELYNEVMLDAIGKDFEKFSVKWNNYQKQVGEKDIMATKNCSRIIGNYNEAKSVGPRNTRPLTTQDREEFEKFRKRWKSLGKNKKKHDSEEDEDYVDDFGSRVNGIEAQVSESDDALWDIEDFLDDQEILNPRDREFVKRNLSQRWGIEDVVDTDDPDWSEAWDDVHSELMLMYGNGHWDESVEKGATIYFKDKSEKPWKLDGIYDIQRVIEEINFVMAREPEGDIPEIDHIKIGNKEYDERDIDKVRREMEDDDLRMIEEAISNDEVKFDTITDIPDWATYYILNGEVTGEMNDDDVELVDNYLAKLKEKGIYLIEPIDGTYNEFNSSPKFGDACDTNDWICEVADNQMNESGSSNGGTIDVTIKFTSGHYGKKLEAGDERTIKVDLSTAPEEMYDEDDFMAWIAKVASDQIPGGGYIAKYDFEIPDDEAYKIIKMVKGEDGFGPDVDVDFDDPDSIPSEVSYEDALKIYKKLREAYDDHKVNYNKYSVIRDKVIDGVVNYLLKHNSLEDLAEKWFIDYGTANGWGWKTSFKYSIASKLHEIHKKKYPDEHEQDRVDTVRGWHEDNCSCGFCSSSDSSD